jgi:hypothetical protein
LTIDYDVFFVVRDGAIMLDVAGPAETFTRSGSHSRANCHLRRLWRRVSELPPSSMLRTAAGAARRDS